MPKSTELATIDASDYPILSGEGGDIGEIMIENLGPDGIQPSDLIRVSIPSGGGQAWEIPSLEGSDIEKSIEGIILHWETNRVYWEKSMEEGGGSQQPNCSSNDGITGVGDYGVGSDKNPKGLCKDCPMSRWGSGAKPPGKKGPQACKEQKIFYVLRENNILPLAITLPPTSITPMRNYMKFLGNAGTAYYTVVTKFGLKKKEGSVANYSVVDPTCANRLDSDTVQAVKEFRQLFTS